MGCGSAGQFWVINGNPDNMAQFAQGTNDSAQWFKVCNSSAANVNACSAADKVFQPPAAGTFNTTQKVRGTIFRPGIMNFNVGLFKVFAINERTGFQFRAEGYNFTNHPNWNDPQLNPTNSNFGKVTTKGGSGTGSGERNLQLSLRYYF